MSNGRLEIEFFTDGQLVPTLEIVNALQDGAIDMSFTSPLYYGGAIPESNLYPSALPPLVLDSIEEAEDLFWNHGVDQVIREAYAEHGVHYLMTLFLGEPGSHWSKKPMPRLADTKGYKIRSFGYAAKVWAKLGASPVFLPHGEVYTSLAQGVLDGSQTAGSYFLRGKYYEVAPYFYLDPQFKVQGMAFLVSKKAWDPLSPDIKAILEAAGQLYSQEYVQQTFVDFEKMVSDFDKLGAKTIKWPDEDLKKIKEVSYTFLDDIASKNARSAKGVKLIKDYLNRNQ
jgi:TRAP-type mannitol/chloroaromatic compound transport system substrate-binding protein